VVFRIHPAGETVQRFIIEQSEADLSSHAGLGLIGMALNERTDLREQAKTAAPARSDAIAHGGVLWVGAPACRSSRAACCRVPSMTCSR